MEASESTFHSVFTAVSAAMNPPKTTFAHAHVGTRGARDGGDAGPGLHRALQGPTRSGQVRVADINLDTVAPCRHTRRSVAW
jgi:hypothetical protein